MRKRRGLAWSLLAVLFDRFRWFRRLYGGHWECWIVDLAALGGSQPMVWHATGDRCSQNPHSVAFGTRPTPLCRGTPFCEDYSASPSPSARRLWPVLLFGFLASGFGSVVGWRERARHERWAVMDWEKSPEITFETVAPSHTVSCPRCKRQLSKFDGGEWSGITIYTLERSEIGLPPRVYKGCTDCLVDLIDDYVRITHATSAEVWSGSQ